MQNQKSHACDFDFQLKLKLKVSLAGCTAAISNPSCHENDDTLFFMFAV